MFSAPLLESRHNAIYQDFNVKCIAVRLDKTLALTSQ